MQRPIPLSISGMLGQEVVLKMRQKLKLDSCTKCILNLTHFWVISFPAFVEPVCLLAECVSFWIQAFLAHADGNVLNFSIQIFDMHLQFLQMDFTVLIDGIRFDKYAVHVTFQIGVIVDFTVTEFFDGFCILNTDRKVISLFLLKFKSRIFTYRR